MSQAPKRLNIYLAEDDPDDQYFIKASLEADGADVELNCFFNGRQLLNALEQLINIDSPLPHLVLLDINMPQLDGVQTLELLKANPNLAHLPVLIYTTSRSEEDIRRVYSLGASAYIVKPLSFGEIQEKFKRVIEFWGAVSEIPIQEVDKSESA